MIPGWIAIMAMLGSFLIGVGVGALAAWIDEDSRRARRRGGFVDPGISRERLALQDELRERRSARGSPRRPRPLGDDAIEGPQAFGGSD